MGRAGIRLTVAGVQTERGELAVAVSEVCTRKRKSEGREGVPVSVISSGEDRDEIAGCGALWCMVVPFAPRHGTGLWVVRAAT